MGEHFEDSAVRPVSYVTDLRSRPHLLASVRPTVSELEAVSLQVTMHLLKQMQLFCPFSQLAA